MLLPKFNYREPKTLTEACQILAELKDRAMPLAGGTDLLVNMKNGILSPEFVVSLAGIPELFLMESSESFFRVGACTSISKFAASQVISEKFSALKSGAMSLASPPIRNLATIGKNIVNASPAADMPPPLMAYGASVVLRNSFEEKVVPLKDIFIGPGQTVINADEILSEIRIPYPPSRSGAAYIRQGNRNGMEIALVNAAAYVELDNRGETIKNGRIVLGAVSPVPLRAVLAEESLRGEKPGGDLFRQAAKTAASLCKPIDDLRGSADYRRAMVLVQVERALEKAYQKAAE